MSAPPPRLTVLTATRDRAHLLPRLAASLRGQDIAAGLAEWLVVDDGSADDTPACLAALAAEGGPVPLRALRVAPGGKHRALNAGFAAARGAWILVVDSDDWLLPGALRAALDILDRDPPDDVFAAIFPLEVPAAPRQFRFARPHRAVTYVARGNEEPPFDATLAFRRGVPGLRFAAFAGEEFLAEGALLYALGQSARVWLADRVLVQAEYQPDGLSARIRAVRMACPLGACHTSQVMLRCALSPALRARALANYARFWWHGVRQGRDVPPPEGPTQRLALGVGWAFCLWDVAAERRARPPRPRIGAISR
jgi:hypothetical protein